MKTRRTFVALLAVLLASRSTHGTLNLQLSGYENIPTDGSALIAITDIGTHTEGRALICLHGIPGVPPTSPIDDWLFQPENGEDEPISSDTGWSVSRDQNDGIVCLERIAGVSPLEGTYTCSVNRIDISAVETVTVYLYWPLTDLVVSFEVLSLVQGSQSYRVSCESVGGQVVSSSFTGPSDETLGELQLVENQEMRGNDRYSQSVVRTGGNDGDVFTCTASTVASAITVNSTLSVAGSVVDLKAIQVPSKTPALNISWTQPQTGAVVTGYTVFYQSTATDGVEHSGGVPTTSDTTTLIDQLLADGRTYSIAVVAHSIHLNGYSGNISYTPCIVSQLFVTSQTSSSLSLTWDRPTYHTGTSITGLLQYSTLMPDSDRKWLYVEESPDALPAIVELEEFTNYSIQMAVVDTSHLLCVFSEPLIALTGLGPVQSLKAQVEEDGIELSWSPPRAPSTTTLSYTVAYTSARSVQSGTTLTVTPDRSWRIQAGLGDVFSFTVTAVSDAGSGESSIITAGVDYKSFQIRIDKIGNCGNWVNTDSNTKHASITGQVTEALSGRCDCDIWIQKSEFYCQSEDQNFVIFCGQLFAPPTISAADLLVELEDWVSSGPTVTIAEMKTVNSNCKPSENNAQSLPCTTPLGESGTLNSAGIMNQNEGENISDGVLVGLAIGCFLIGVLFALVALLSLYIIKRRYNLRRDSNLNRQAHSLAYSENCEHNPRYVSAGDSPPQRELPLLPLCVQNNTVTFSNPVAMKDGACANTSPENVDSNHTYEITPLRNSKVVNPLYEDLTEASRTKPHKQQVTVCAYENIGPLETQPMDGEYVVMNSTTHGTASEYETAR